MRKAILAAFVAILAGCSGPTSPTFRDEAEELAYLKTQANPTVDQFRRRAELEAKGESGATKAEEDAEDQAAYDRTFLLGWQKRAREKEDAGDLAGALEAHNQIVLRLKNKPDSPDYRDAIEARERLGKAGAK